jgi:DNA-binding MarR family transcriptional regulator
MRYDEALDLNELLKMLGMRHRARATQLLTELGLNIGQEQLLLELDRNGPSTQTQLAIAASCEPPTVTIAVRKLEAAGIVTRAPSPADARAVVVRLTEAGKALIPQLHSSWTQLATETFQGMTKAERETLISLLRRATDNLARASRKPRSREGIERRIDARF